MNQMRNTPGKNDPSQCHNPRTYHSGALSVPMIRRTSSIRARSSPLFSNSSDLFEAKIQQGHSLPVSTMADPKPHLCGRRSRRAAVPDGTGFLVMPFWRAYTLISSSVMTYARTMRFTRGPERAPVFCRGGGGGEYLRASGVPECSSS